MSRFQLPDICTAPVTAAPISDQLDRRLLRIQPLAGHATPITVEAYATDSVAELKLLIERQSKIAAKSQVLSWNGVILRPNEALLESWDIPTGALVHLSVAMKTGRMKSPASKTSGTGSLFPAQVVLFLCRCDLQLFILEVTASVVRQQSRKSLSYGGILLVQNVSTSDILIALAEKVDIGFNVTDIQKLVLRSVALAGDDEDGYDDVDDERTVTDNSSEDDSVTCKGCTDDDSNYEDISEDGDDCGEREAWSRLLPNISRQINRCRPSSGSSSNLNQALPPSSLKRLSSPLSSRYSQANLYGRHQLSKLDEPAPLKRLSSPPSRYGLSSAHSRNQTKFDDILNPPAFNRLSTPPRRLPRIGSATKSKPGSPASATTCSPLASRRDLPARASSRLDIAPKNAPIKNRCHWCSVKLSPAAMMLPCKCGGHFCIKHRYSGRHACRQFSIISSNKP